MYNASAGADEFVSLLLMSLFKMRGLASLEGYAHLVSHNV